jgi:hypothetical protein
MAITYNSERQTQSFHMPAKSGWMPTLLFVGSVGIALFLLWALQEETYLPTDKPGNTVSLRTPEEAKPSIGAQKPRSLGLRDSRFALGQHLPDATVGDDRSTGRHAESQAQPVEPPQHSWELDTLVAKVKNAQTLTLESAKDTKRLLKELRKQGVAAVPAIREFLRQKEDVNFDKISGGELAEHHTLRQALFDTLRRIGGAAAMAVSLEQLGGNQDPAEIAMLARNLEEEAPGVYRQQILQTTSSALQLLARDKEVVEVRPLFELLQELGGVEAAAILGQFPANANTVQYLRNKDTGISPTVRTYALISLASLPDGEGVLSLAALAGDPDVPVQNKPELPFQMLAQSAMEYDEAGDALVDLARARQIPDRAWEVVGEALQGKYLQFPSQFSGGVLPGEKGADRSGIEAPFVRGYYDDDKNIKYEQRLVSADWSAKQIQQQLALIDKLLSVTSSPTGVKVLQQVRASLQGDSH